MLKRPVYRFEVSPGCLEVGKHGVNCLLTESFSSATAERLILERTCVHTVFRVQRDWQLRADDVSINKWEPYSCARQHKLLT
jgi:hypothetical protein